MFLRAKTNFNFTYTFDKGASNLLSWGKSWLWSYGSWINSYLCNQCLLPIMLWVRIPFRRGVLDTTLYDKVYQWLAAVRWFSPSIPVSSTNKTDCHDRTEILLKVALNTITLSPILHIIINLIMKPPSYWVKWQILIKIDVDDICM